MTQQHAIPAWQQAIIDKCYHPTGVWEEFALTEVESSVGKRFAKIVERYGHRPAIIHPFIRTQKSAMKC